MPIRKSGGYIFFLRRVINEMEIRIKPVTDRGLSYLQISFLSFLIAKQELSYRILPALFSKTTLESMAVSVLAGRCEQKPMPA